MTLLEFSAVFSLLATQLRQTDADEAAIDAYYAGLKDLDLELVAMAATDLARTAQWFPKTSEWREAVVAVEQRRIEAQRALLRKLAKRGESLCAACQDTQWERVGDSVRRCSCLKERQLEILGLRPWPALESGDAA